MKAIIGLGNPEDVFEGTRHNVGFAVVDRLASKFSLANFTSQSRVQAQISKSQKYILAKPTTYMNNSGIAVRSILDYYKIETPSTYIILDDLDLELGNYKIQFATGPHGHNGLLSIYQHLGTKNFWHVRVGVDGRSGARSSSPQEYVLGRFSREESAALAQVQEELVRDLTLQLELDQPEIKS